MLGMNRFHQKDTKHSFDMSALDGYNVVWLPQVKEIEKTNSTLFYEALYGIEKARIELKDERDNYLFIFGRGTIGAFSEEWLFEALQQAMHYYGNDANHIMVAKSFGVADTLTALTMFKIYHKKPNIQSLITLDGFLPPTRKRKLAKKDDGEWYFKIPNYVKRHFNVVQRLKGTKGRLVIEKDHNLILRQNYIDKFDLIYDHYNDGYKRELEASHFNMEEIVSVIPSIKLDTDIETLPRAIERSITTYYQ